MNTWPSIHREAALALCPDDVAKGNRELDVLIKSAARCIAKREALLTGSYALSGAAFVMSCVTYPIFAYQEPPWALASNLALATLVLSATAAALTWWGWTAIQHRRFAKRIGDLSGMTIPPPLQELINSFASGVREVRTAPGDKVFPGLFASRWAIMLFSHDPRQRLLVRGPRGEKHKPQIYAQPKEPNPVEALAAQGDAEPLPSGPRVETHWIVKIPAERFADWKSLVQQRGPWDVLTQIEVGQVLDDARRKAEGDALAGKKFSVHGFAKRAKMQRLSAETIRKLIAWSGEHDYDWVRKSAEEASIGSDQVG